MLKPETQISILRHLEAPERVIIYDGVNLTVQDYLRQDSRIQDLYVNISEVKLPITSLYIISDALKYNIIWTENSDVNDSSISEILKYESSIHTIIFTQN